MQLLVWCENHFKSPKIVARNELSCYLYVPCLCTHTYIGPPSNISVTFEVCLNDIIISSLRITSDPVCGDVSYYVRKADTMRITDIMRINEFPHKLNRLTPNTNYIISILPMNNAGYGEPYNRSITTAPSSKL